MSEARAGALLLAWALGLGTPTALSGQAAADPAPVIDTIVVITHNVFTPAEEQKSFVFRTINRVRFSTRDYVVWNELLFARGERYDSVNVAETERNLRARQIFRYVDIDTARIDDRFAVVVDTRDGWSTKVKFQLAAASEGSWTGLFGVTEMNLLGTGNLAHAAYRKDTDRDGLELMGDFRRFFSSRFSAAGSYFAWSDGNQGDWSFGAPFLSTRDRVSFWYSGEAADRRVLQYLIDDPAAPDTTFYWRRAYIQRLSGAFAPVAQATRYLRLGATAEVRREEYLLQRDTGLVIPDTVTGLVGMFAEYRRARYREVSYFNGFADEDIDLSTWVRLTTKLAPSAFGYERTGVGPRLDLATALPLANGFIKGAISAHGLFNAAGLDSGRVVLSLTFGVQPLPRHATALQIVGGIQEDPPPGEQFDLGFLVPPRSWEPHSFTGTRAIWGTVEHRWFALDGIFNIFDLGFAAFLDVGGAWYRDQSARFGGNVGIGLRPGGALSASVRTARFDLGYRFGDGLIGRRWVLSFGPSFSF